MKKRSDSERAREWVNTHIRPDEYETLDDYLSAVESAINKSYVQADKDYYGEVYGERIREVMPWRAEAVFYRDQWGHRQVRMRDPETKRFIKWL